MGKLHTPSTSADFPARGRSLDSSGPADFAQAEKHYSEKRFALAEERCLAILGITPLHAPALHLLGCITVEQGRPMEGLKLVEQALGLEPRNPTYHFARGQILMRVGDATAAAQALSESARLDSVDPRIHQHLILALIACRRLSEAESVLSTALRKWPTSAGILDASGMVLIAQGRLAEAQVVLERGRELAPDYQGTYANLAIVHEQSNHLDAALELIQEGLQRWPAHRTLSFIRARCLRRLGKYAEARRALQELLQGELTDKLRADIEYELGWCADGMRQTAEAYRHFIRANLVAEKLPAKNVSQGADYLHMLTTLQKQYERDWVASWSKLPPSGHRPDPIFIIGFPRSGTTLLDTMLGAHPEIKLLEEPATIQAMLENLAIYEGGYPAGLARLTANQRSHLRSTYFQAAGMGATVSAQQRLLDKSPFNTAHAGLIHRVFPEAMLIFVARHPCDVCLSCFMNNFEMNSGTQHFTRLDTTVKLYCQMMALWITYVKILPLRYQVVRYEDLVGQPEMELRHLLDSLGVSWSASVLQHTAHAMQRSHIPTPSYAQVHRPIYFDACDRWRRYADVMQPFLKELQPYIKAFGYDI